MHSTALHQCLPLPRKRSPDGVSPDWGCAYLIAAYYSFIYPERMKGWVGLVGWPTADCLPTKVVTHQLQVECRTVKVRRSKTDVLPTVPLLTLLLIKFIWLFQSRELFITTPRNLLDSTLFTAYPSIKTLGTSVRLLVLGLNTMK